MKIVFTDSTSTGSLRDSGEALTVTSVSRMATTNQIGVSPNLTTISGVASGDFVIPQGDLETPGTYLVMAGMEDWIPASAPGSTAFFGQDRSKDVTRLGGQRVAFDTSISKRSSRQQASFPEKAESLMLHSSRLRILPRLK